MPTIAPSRLVRYSAAGDLSRFVAPPYDVLDDARRAALEAADPHNIVRLTLPAGAPAERYQRARALLDAWLSEGVLKQDAEPSLLLVTQEFVDPRTGERRVRHGVQALLKLSEPGEGAIRAHEKTLAAPKADRLGLLQATATHLSPVFVLFPDDTNEVFAPLVDLLATPPDFSAVVDGTIHRAWRVVDPQRIAAVQARIAKRPGYIADGHHRYETALRHRAQLRETGTRVDGTAADYIPAFLCGMGDPGLSILPTHRLLLVSPPAPGSRETVQRFFDLTRLAVDLGTAEGRATALARLAERIGTPSFIVAVGDGETFLATLRPDAPLGEVPNLPQTPALRKLDVVALHAILLDHAFGFTAEMQEGGATLTYVKDADEALKAAWQKATKFAFLLNPLRIEDLRAVADAGAVLPPKSTWFHPKLVDGFGLSPLDGEVP